jgi:hypothetical protein
MRCATFSAAQPIATAASSPSVSWVVLHRNRRCLAARAHRSARRKAGPTRRKRSIHIEQTDTHSRSIEWKDHYRIERSAFVYHDQDTCRATTVLGYPTDTFAQMV